MIFPEGTLVSKDTRPVSKKFADKCGIVSRYPEVLYTSNYNEPFQPIRLPG